MPPHPYRLAFSATSFWYSTLTGSVDGDLESGGLDVPRVSATVSGSTI